MRLNVDLETLIWDSNPMMKVIFNDFYKKDKSKQKSDSSQVLTVLYFLNHPDSELKDLPEEDLIKDLTSSGFLTINWDREKYAKVEERFLEKCMTAKERIAQGWEDKLLERDRFMRDKPYNEENYEMLDKMMGNNKKLWDYYMQALKDLELERAELTSGNLVESATEDGSV